MSYLPIADYGVIGDMRSVALVGKNGSIDWCCLPRFDSPSLFAALLDDQKGGRFCLQPVCECGVKQMYLPDTNVLVTRFMSDEGLAEVTDFMPIGREAGGETEQPARQVLRIAKAIRGPIRFYLECLPAFALPRQKHQLELCPDGNSASLAIAGHTLLLTGSQRLRCHEDGVRA